jgi:hypothetical protein
MSRTSVKSRLALEIADVDHRLAAALLDVGDLLGESTPRTPARAADPRG